MKVNPASLNFQVIPPIQRSSGALAPEATPDTGTSEGVEMELGMFFEGPEKKLEVVFSQATPAGLRSFGLPSWSQLVADAGCAVLHHHSNSHFDAYLLSESSLFVFPRRIIMKTCGQTTPLLALPRLIDLADQLDAKVEHVHYSHYRYKKPSLQCHPHRSFAEEEESLITSLRGHVAAVQARVLGPPDTRCWYSLCTEKDAESCGASHVLAPVTFDGVFEDVFEVAMEGLAPSVCALFFASSYTGEQGRRLACAMTEASGIQSLLSGVTIDDWAFLPVGYSMNGLRDNFYYTIHVTPEMDFSYASFETNDPAYCCAEVVATLVKLFDPSVLTLSLATRRSAELAFPLAGRGSHLPAFELSGFTRTAYQHSRVTPSLSITCVNFSRHGTPEAVTVEGIREGIDQNDVPLLACDDGVLVPCTHGELSSMIEMAVPEMAGLTDGLGNSEACALELKLGTRAEVECSDTDKEESSSETRSECSEEASMGGLGGAREHFQI